MKQHKDKNNKIRLLHLVNTLGVAGAEVLLSQYIRALGNENYNHYVYILEVDGPIREKIEGLCLNICKGKKRAALKNPLKFVICALYLVIHLLFYIRKNRINVILSQSIKPNQLAVIVAKLSKIPVFVFVHSTMAFVDNRSKWDPRVYLNRVLNIIIYRLADLVIAISSEIKEIIHKSLRLKNSKIIIIKSGIIFNDDKFRPANLLKEFPQSKNKIKIIAVGRLVSLKGFEILIKAIAEINRKGERNFFTLIVGKGEDRIRLEKLISALNINEQVKLLGLRNDVIPLMISADIFIMPSYYEGLSIAMIEAMACSLSIIASDAPGVGSHIKPYENGILFKVGCHRSLAGCILALTRDKELMSTLSNGARNAFETEFDMGENIKTLDKLIRKYML